MQAMEGPMAGRSQGMGTTMNYEVLPVTLIILAAFILFVSSQRTRGLLLRSIDQANRVFKAFTLLFPGTGQEPCSQ